MKTKSSKARLENWMSNKRIQALCFWDVILPGTHNSVSWCCNMNDKGRWSMEKMSFLRKYILCQNCTIYQQLMKGARFLDIRVCKSLWPSQETYCAHNGFLTVPFRDALKDIAAFCSAYPTEVTVLSVRRDVAHLRDSQSVGIVESDFLVALMLQLYLGPALTAKTTIGELVNRHQNVIYFFEERERYLPTPTFSHESHEWEPDGTFRRQVDARAHKEKKNDFQDNEKSIQYNLSTHNATLVPNHCATSASRKIIATLVSPTLLQSSPHTTSRHYDCETDTSEIKSTEFVDNDVTLGLPIPNMKPSSNLRETSVSNMQQLLLPWLKQNIPNLWFARLESLPSTIYEQFRDGVMSQDKQSNEDEREHSEECCEKPAALKKGHHSKQKGKQTTEMSNLPSVNLVREHQKDKNKGSGGKKTTSTKHKLNSKTADHRDKQRNINLQSCSQKMNDARKSSQRRVKRKRAKSTPPRFVNPVCQVSKTKTKKSAKQRGRPQRRKIRRADSLLFVIQHSRSRDVYEKRLLRRCRSAFPFSLPIVNNPFSSKRSVVSGGPPYTKSGCAGSATTRLKNQKGNSEDQYTTLVEGVNNFLRRPQNVKLKSDTKPQNRVIDCAATSSIDFPSHDENMIKGDSIVSSNASNDPQRNNQYQRLVTFSRFKARAVKEKRLHNLYKPASGNVTRNWLQNRRLRRVDKESRENAKANNSKGCYNALQEHRSRQRICGGGYFQMMLTPFVGGSSMIIKSWSDTYDTHPAQLCNKLVKWAFHCGSQPPRHPFVLRILAGEITPPSFESTSKILKTMQFWTSRCALAMFSRHEGLSSYASRTNKLLLSNVLSPVVLERVNGITHDFCNAHVMSKVVDVNFVIASRIKRARRASKD